MFWYLASEDSSSRMTSLNSSCKCKVSYSRLAMSLVPDKYDESCMADLQKLAINRSQWDEITQAQTSEISRRTRVV